MGVRYIEPIKAFDSRRVKKSKKNKAAQELCDMINSSCRGFSNPEFRDLAAPAAVIQIKLMGGVSPECAPYEVSDEEMINLERIAFMIT